MSPPQNLCDGGSSLPGNSCKPSSPPLLVNAHLDCLASVPGRSPRPIQSSHAWADITPTPGLGLTPSQFFFGADAKNQRDASAVAPAAENEPNLSMDPVLQKLPLDGLASCMAACRSGASAIPDDSGDFSYWAGSPLLPENFGSSPGDGIECILPGSLDFNGDDAEPEVSVSMPRSLAAFRTCQLPPDCESQAEHKSPPRQVPCWHLQSQTWMSHGASLHGTGKCKPCAWFWKPQGCHHADMCNYCHLCPEGELKRRKKEKVDAMRIGALIPSQQAGPGALEGPPHVLRISVVV